jgi:uncharacterized protein (TIGR02996 family)
VTATIETWHDQIAEAPEDIDLRLVFTDWLLERGDPLGEFIQFECRLLREPDHADALKWRRRANALRKAHAKSWWGDVGAKAVRGGMIEGVYGVSRDGWDHLWRVAPALVELGLALGRVPGSPERAEIAFHPIWHRVRRLEVRADFVVLAIEALMVDNLPNVERLRGLSLSRWIDRLIEVLGQHAPRLAPRLARLEIPQCDIPPATVVRLGAWDHSLAALDLYGNALSREGVAALASGRLLVGIRELMLGRTGIGPEGVMALAACPHLATLERLDLRRAGLSSKAADVAGALAALVAAAPRLVALELMSARIGPAEVPILTAGDPLPALRELSLQGCDIGDAGLARLLESALAPRLAALNLRNNGLTDASARALAETRALSDLRLLNLESNPITKEGLTILRGTPALAHVTITAGSTGSQLFAEPRNEKEGFWLGSTNYKEYNVLRRPASAKQRKTTKRGERKRV